MGPPTRSVLNGPPSRRRRGLAAVAASIRGDARDRDDRQRSRAMPFEFSVSDLIPASPQDIYDAWLSSSGHEKLTGGQKAQISAQEGGAFTVWNGYITGRNLKLEPGRRIVQSWRTTKFAATDADSRCCCSRRRAAPRSRCGTATCPTVIPATATADGSAATSSR